MLTTYEKVFFLKVGGPCILHLRNTVLSSLGLQGETNTGLALSIPQVDKSEKVIHQLFWSHDTPFIGGCFFYFSTFFKSCYSVNSFFLYFLLGSLTSWLIFFFFNVHAVKFTLCSAQFYGIWQMYRFMYLPPQYHIEHFTALKITWCGPFIENLCPSPSSWQPLTCFLSPQMCLFQNFLKVRSYQM